MKFEEACKNIGITPVTLTVNIGPDTYDELINIADIKGLQVDDLVRNAIDKYLMEEFIWTNLMK